MGERLQYFHEPSLRWNLRVGGNKFGAIGNDRKLDLSVRRNYTLPRDVNFNTWLCRLQTELRHHRFLDVLEPDAAVRLEYDPDVAVEREVEVRDLIISLVDDKLRAKIRKFEDPRDMIDYLTTYFRTQANTTEYTVRQRLRQKRMDRTETATEFIDRFEEVLNEFENLGRKIDDDDLTSIFYANNRALIPKVVNKWENHKQIFGVEMNFMELKNALLQAEAERKESIVGAIDSGHM